ncbi:hypothetical protein CBD41_00755 [bacterium TMED181]|nr:hypothetical protein [Planctomycetota bacterium]OUW47514.1 MAG: hypothetical protein CBD41_00755 [bacterium TMED181]
MSNPQKNKIGFFSSSVVVFTTVVGAGVFTTSGYFASNLGEGWAVLAAVLLAGVLAFTSALTTAELGAMIPSSGGEVVYLRRALGPLASYVFGMISGPCAWTVGSAFVAGTLGKHLSNLFPAVDETLAALLSIFVILGIHLRGLKTGVLFNNFMTVIKVALILVFILAGLSALAWGEESATPLSEALFDSMENDSPRSIFGWLEQIFFASIIAGFSFAGYNAIVLMAGEVEEPEHIIPRALIFGLGLITLLYLLVNTVFVWATPAAQMLGPDGGVITDLGTHTARVLYGDSAAKFFDAVFILVLIPTLSSCLQASSRVIWRLAQDGDLFARLGTTSESGTPRPALILQALLLAVAVTAVEKEYLLLLNGMCVLIMDFPTAITIFLLRRKEPKTPRPFRVPWYPWVPMVRVLLAVYAGYSFVKADISHGPLALGLILIVLALRPLFRQVNHEK